MKTEMYIKYYDKILRDTHVYFMCQVNSRYIVLLSLYEHV